LTAARARATGRDRQQGLILKLLILGKYYAPVRGGIETHTRDLALAVGPHHEVRVLVHNEGADSVIERVDGIELIRAGTVARPLKQPISPDVFRHIRDFAPDVIHVHAPNIWATLAALAVGGKARIVVTHHADIVGREPVRSAALVLYRSLVRRSAALVVSASNNQAFSRDLKGVKVAARAIPFCLEPSPFADEPGFADAARALRTARFGDRPVAAFVGRLVPYKGADRLIAALAAAPGVGAVIIGGGPSETALKRQAQALGVDDRIHFAGSCDDRTKALWLAACDMFVLPSVTAAEAFGIVQIEAMLWGKPVIATNLPSGVPQVGQDGETCLIVPPGDVPALAGAIGRLAKDPTLRDQLGQAGLSRARDLYSTERFNRAMLDLYDEVAAAPPRP
jgi:rhamnosyl/mannosyltransferase